MNSSSKDIRLVDIFKEFIELSYKFNSNNYPKEKRDIKVDDYIIVRVSSSCYEVIYLFNGNRLRIPWEWIDLFSSFNSHSGNKIQYYSISIGEDDYVDPNDLLLKYFSDISYCLRKNLSRLNSDSFLKALGEISLIKTKNFRDWCSKNFNIILDPLEYITKNTIIKI